MKKSVMIAIVIAIVAAVSFGMYEYMNGRDAKLYEEAKILEANGEFKAAHDKVVEALEINPKNKKILVYKTQLFNIVQNDSFIKSAVKNRDDAIRAMNRGDYVTASENLDAALYNVAQVSPSVKGYENALELQKQLLKDSERLLKEAPEKYYMQAIGYAQTGEYEKAYNFLEYILKPDPKVIKLKNDLAYRIGAEKYNECVSNPYPTSFLLRDAVMWLSKVSPVSGNMENAKAMIRNLEAAIAKVEKKSR